MKYSLMILMICWLSISWATTIQVGVNKQFSRLGDAIRAARPGDTILLHKGIYREGNLIISKPLFLIGVDVPVLDGALKGELLTLTGKNIHVSGIRFINAGYSSMHDFAAIKIIDAQNITVANNTITNASF